MTSRNKWLCLDCGTDTGKIGEHYMLLDEVWSKIHTSSKGMLCVKCCEKRLNRELTKADFNDSYVNNPHTGWKSALLMERMS